MYEFFAIGFLLGWAISSFVDCLVFRKHRNTLKERDYFLDLNLKQNDEIKYLKSVLDTDLSKHSDGDNDD